MSWCVGIGVGCLDVDWVCGIFYNIGSRMEGNLKEEIIEEG